MIEVVVLVIVLFLVLLSWGTLTVWAWFDVTEDVDDPREVLSWRGVVLLFPHYLAWRLNEWVKRQSVKND